MPTSVLIASLVLWPMSSASPIARTDGGVRRGARAACRVHGHFAAEAGFTYVLPAPDARQQPSAAADEQRLRGAAEPPALVEQHALGQPGAAVAGMA